VVTLSVPPLRDRREDIPLLADRFLRTASSNIARRLHFSEEALERLTAYEWPGNVRELENAVERAALHARGNEVATNDLPSKIQSAELGARANQRSPLAALYSDLVSLDELERRYLIHVLEAVGGNRTRAAEVLRIDRRTLYRMAERFGIKLENDREPIARGSGTG
jgi:DNA-binding NtrC family response regulator